MAEEEQIPLVENCLVASRPGRDGSDRRASLARHLDFVLCAVGDTDRF